ncbi:hypothetical protein [Methylobacterium goesingense]|uniref:Uncharacterized protein n=1 Tax=Methylobacterium goesingense TaxID=243690 RepID=A0ABV2L334_9HYPH|nr:hypothetical protein [Methylobacterium goesingense]GJD76386.1 hypothetical protein CFIICLFH_4642 [Methylobacterium goesingense]
MSRLSRAALLMLTLPMMSAMPAAAQSPAKDYLFQEQRFSRACRPPLKYAAGACVRRCPAGFEDMGRTCRQRSMRGGAGGR